MKRPPALGYGVNTDRQTWVALSERRPVLAAAEEVMRNGGAVVVGAEAGHPLVDHFSHLNSLVTAVALSLKIF